jgi:hypothetical protein
VRELDEYLFITRVSSPAPLGTFAESVRVARLVAGALAPGAPVSDSEREHLRAGLLELGHVCVRAAGGARGRLGELCALPVWSSAPATDPADLSADELLRIWRRGHWMFFVLTQGLIVASKRLFVALAAGDLQAAELELGSVSQLLWASGSAMRVTGSFTASEYHRVVRPTMTEGHELSLVRQMSLSGTMTWDHHYLVHRIWREELRPVLQTLPASLAPAYEKFLVAYRDGLSDGHKAVCARFGGEEMGSLVAPHVLAVKSIESIDQKRLAQLALPIVALD